MGSVYSQREQEGSYLSYAEALAKPWPYLALWPPCPTSHVPDRHSPLTSVPSLGMNFSSVQSHQTPGCRDGSVSKDAGLETQSGGRVTPASAL